MSLGLRRSQARLDRARDTLAMQRVLANRFSEKDPRHRPAMELVFLCEDTLFVLAKTHAMIAGLEARQAQVPTAAHKPAGAASSR